MNTSLSRRAKPHRINRRQRQALYGVVYILPSFLIIFAFSVIPIAMAIYFSFTKYNLVGAPQWIGLENYVKLASNSYLHAALRNTVVYVLITVPCQTIFALSIAAFLGDKLQNSFGGMLRSVMFIPVIASLIASATVWRVMYDANGGIINQLLGVLGVAPVNWLGSKSTALPAVAAVAIWKNTGYFLVIYYAGIMNISTEIREAAIVDGANGWQRFFRITVPILKPITYMVVTLGIIWSFQVFDLVFKMTGGGPGRSTYTVAYVIYTYAFQDKRIGYACALAVCLLLVILVIHGVQRLFFKEKDDAEKA